MALIAFATTVAAAGTPVSLQSGYAGPAVTMGGVTYMSGVTLRGAVRVQNRAAMGNLYVGTRGMGTPKTQGQVITPGQTLEFGDDGHPACADDFLLDADTSGMAASVTVNG